MRVRSFVTAVLVEDQLVTRILATRIQRIAAGTK